VADVLAELARANYLLQFHTSKNYEEATHQAEKAIKIYGSIVKKNNIKLVEPNSVLAAILDDQTTSLSGKHQHKLWKKSTELKQFCLDTCIEQRGEYNAGTAKSYVNLGKLYRKMEQNTLAEEMLLK
jgi:hypothetical protein